MRRGAESDRVRGTRIERNAVVRISRRQIEHVPRRQHVVVLGPVGVGKTFVSQALGRSKVDVDQANQLDGLVARFRLTSPSVSSSAVIPVSSEQLRGGRRSPEMERQAKAA